MASETDDAKILSLIQQSMKSSNIQLKDSEQTKILGIIKKMLTEGVSLRESMGLNQQFLESLYGLAYQLYNSGKYKDSGSVFRLLSVTDPEDTRFTMGLAASKQMVHDYDEAINAYLACGQQDLLNPMPYFYLYECYRQTKRVRESFYALCETIKRIQRNPIYLPLLNKTIMMLEGLQKEVEEENYDLLKEKHLLKEDFDRNKPTEPLQTPLSANEVPVETPETKRNSVEAG